MKFEKSVYKVLINTIKSTVRGMSGNLLQHEYIENCCDKLNEMIDADFGDLE